MTEQRQIKATLDTWWVVEYSLNGQQVAFVIGRDTARDQMIHTSQVVNVDPVNGHVDTLNSRYQLEGNGWHQVLESIPEDGRLVRPGPEKKIPVAQLPVAQFAVYDGLLSS